MRDFILPFNLSKKENLLIKKRLSEFKCLSRSDSNTWFSELCFCILTANAQAQKAINIQEKIGVYGFQNFSESKIREILKFHGHRFHNRKAQYIVEARSSNNIKEKLAKKSGYSAREYIERNIKGLGYKEASHFLRNVGFDDVAIIDRHVLKFLLKYGFIKHVPASLTKKRYLEIENILKKFKLSLSFLDLAIWYHMTGKILK